MDQRTGCLLLESVTPQMSKLVLDFTDTALFQTMKNVEHAYWDYLDNYASKNRHKYPHIRMPAFLQTIMEYNKCTQELKNVHIYCKLYDRYKKSLPTAGVILHHGTEFVVVRMKTAKIWSMPKGKQDQGEPIERTAIREFREETGIDLEDLITDRTPQYTVLKTLFYIIEADHRQPRFKDYNANEIAEVKWVSATDVLRQQSKYSKQTVAAAELLNGSLAQ